MGLPRDPSAEAVVPVAASDAARAEQAAVTALPWDASGLVLAGPGTGKTYTLLARATLLISEQGLAPSEILVLSFTRAIVRELRRRDRATSSPSRILPETFDSFASRLLREQSTESGWESAGYDRRIEVATSLLRSDVGPALAQVRHVLVDEVQDLIGVRASFVERLLETIAGGWTAFGDPAQAIYDYERAEPDNQPLVVSLARRASISLTLETDHRTERGGLTDVSSLRSRLLDGNGDGEAELVWDAYRELATLGDIDDVPAQLGGLRGTLGLLCRDNATALRCSGALRDAGIDHRVRRGTADRPVAGWLAGLVAGRTAINKETCASALAELEALGFPNLPSADESWEVISRMDRNSRTGTVRTSEIASRLSTRRIPWQLCDEPEARIVISSIHRAKGLEFDQVAILEWRPPDSANVALEARVLYVALSRARRDAFHVAPLPWEPWLRRREAQDRFVKLGPQKWHTFGIEMRGDDVHHIAPAGAFGVEHDSVETQRHLIESVRPGDDVTLTYVDEVAFGDVELPAYSVVHGAGLVGITGEAFGLALQGRLAGRRRPSRITNARVDDLETVKGSSDVADAAGLGRSGIWLCPRLVGLGEFDWS